MSHLISRLRAMAHAGSADYTLAGAVYWSDEQLQDILDLYRTDLVRAPLRAVAEYDGEGSLQHIRYNAPVGNLESTPEHWRVEDSAGNAAGTASYTADYNVGQITFGADTGGTAYYLTARTYDVYAAAADLLRRKAAHYAEMPTFSSDNHSVSLGDLIANCLQMADVYAHHAAPGELTTERWDVAE